MDGFIVFIASIILESVAAALLRGGAGSGRDEVSRSSTDICDMIWAEAKVCSD